ncbi:hypothetical protein C3E98_033060, partial [Pseudomonas sp. MWU13-2625]
MAIDPTRHINIVALCGSLRAHSYNAALLDAAALVAPSGMRIVRFDRLGEFPLFNPDAEYPSPAAVRDLIERLNAADGVLIARRGLGSYISKTPAGTVFRFPPGDGRLPDLAQMFEMRLWIETQAASIAAQRRDAADLHRIQEALQEMHDKRSHFEAAG